MGTIRVIYREDEDVVAALCEEDRVLRADVRTVLDTAKGGVINLPKAWAGKRVIVVEMPETKGRRR